MEILSFVEFILVNIVLSFFFIFILCRREVNKIFYNLILIFGEYIDFLCYD